MMFKMKIIAALFIVSVELFSQSILSKDDALAIALKNNYNIQVVNKSVEMAKNNSGVLNSDYLPTLNLSSGASYSKNETDYKLSNGSTVTIGRDPITAANSSLALNYVLFNGFGRSFNYKLLKETYKLSKLQAKFVMEQECVKVYSAYYDIARLVDDFNNQKETMQISRARLIRLKSAFEFGQVGKIDVLNAEVDYNSDSVNYLNISQLLANAKRNLNYILGRDITTEFDVSGKTEIKRDYNQEELLLKAMDYNILMQQNNVSLKSRELEEKITRAALYPTISANVSYGLDYSNREMFLGTNRVNSMEGTSAYAGLSMSWSLFDGGSRYVRRKNARLSIEQQKLENARVESELKTSFYNLWGNFTNAILKLSVEEKSVETSTLNFERSKELFNLGRITSVEFRTAQLNLLRAKQSLNLMRFEAKLAEVNLLQVSGVMFSEEV